MYVIYVSIRETVLDRGELKSNDLYSRSGLVEASWRGSVGEGVVRRQVYTIPSVEVKKNRFIGIHWYSTRLFVCSFLSTSHITSRMNEFMYRDKCST